MSSKLLKENLYGALRNTISEMTGALDAAKSAARISGTILDDKDRTDADAKRVIRAQKRVQMIDRMISQMEQEADELFEELYEETIRAEEQ